MKRSYLLLFLIGFMGCGDNGREKDLKIFEMPMLQIPLLLQEMSAKEDGKMLYQKYCLSCHQAEGDGVPGMYPPLKESDWVRGEKRKLVDVVSHGISDEIQVNGVLYNQSMPSLSYLTNSQIAGILTYIRSHFKNKASKISLNEINQWRKDSL